MFKNWQVYKRKSFKLTFKLNSKHTNYNCNLLNFTDDLTLTKPQKTSMTKFQKKYNYKLCLIQAVFNTFKTVCWIEPQNVELKKEHKIKHIKPIRWAETYVIHNKQEFEIEAIDNNYIVLTDGKILDLHVVVANFQPNYARTIDSFQGDRITKPFGIVGLKNKHFTVERLNSAIGRAVCKDLVHIDWYDEDRVYQSKQYPKEVIINVEPEISDYSHVLFYGVYDKNDTLMYIGTTTQSIEERMEQHYKDKATDKFHVWLRTVSKDDIVVKSMCGDAMAFDCWGDVEDFEMELVQKHEPLLNTRKHTQRQTIIEIKTPELETMTKEEYDAIKYYKKEEKEIKPHFETIESKKTIRLRFNHNGQRFEKNKSYSKGYDKAKQ